MPAALESQEVPKSLPVLCKSCGEPLAAGVECCPMCGGKEVEPGVPSPPQESSLAGAALHAAAGFVRKVFISIVGGTVLLIGIIMIVGPGPAFIVIPAGLGILATEFVWARVALKRLKAEAEHASEYTWRFLFGGKPKDKQAIQK